MRNIIRITKLNRVMIRRRIKDIMPKNLVLKILIVLIFLYMLSGILIGQHFFYISIGNKLNIKSVIYVQYIVSIIVTAVLSYTTVTSNFFHADDFFVLAALPMKPKEILYAKSVSLLLAYEFVQSLIIVPSVITFLRLGEVMVITTFLIHIILLTVVTFLIVGIICSLSVLGKSYKGIYRISSMIVGILVLCGVVCKIVSIYTCVMKIIGVKDTNKTLFIRIIEKCYNESVVMKSICHYSYVSILILGVIIVLLCIILAKLFGKCVVAYDFSEVKSVNYRLRLGKTSNKMLLLLQREFWVVQSEPFFKSNLILECCLAPLFLTIVSIILHFAKTSKEIEEFLNLANGKWYLAYIIIGVIVLIISTQASFLVPVSKEGKFYMLSRTLPIPYEMQYKAKSIYTFILSTVSGSIAYWIVIITKVFVFQHRVLNYIILLEVLFLLVVTCSASDYRRPYINWDEPRKATNGNLMLLFGVLHVFAILAVILGIILGGEWLIKNELIEKICLILVIFIMDIASEKWNISRANRRYKNVQI
ncbi:hypothetical protein [[Clostridium] polysaccharolyticum]|uniref:ABC-2 type transport system permease protein n=1 Tax=[Clostridium] polysaccharolyticum TaxID=29364 RepID=A0A1I0DQL1_9FIRM|nr:hypothetical protein [[Clostridium] polysaccharolyticum]SET34462.1 hypothetical protein SAMN04487772_1162 [[Clostridium] polysaccharolyticum]